MLHKTPAEKHHCSYSASTGPRYGQLFWMEPKQDMALVLSPMQGKTMCSSHPGKLMRGSPELKIFMCKLASKYPSNFTGATHMTEVKTVLKLPSDCSW